MSKQVTCARAPGGVAALLVGAALFAGCATTEGSSASQALPKNHREQIAAKLRQMEDPSVIQYVGITQPKTMFVGIMNGGTRPAVCVRVDRPDAFGARGSWYYSFYAENGQVDGFKRVPMGALQAAMLTCDAPLANITHLVRSRR
jgi:hypothetical protein